MSGKPMERGTASRIVMDNIRRLRIEQQLGYTELSRRLAAAGHKIPPLGLTRLEAGNRRIDIDDLVAFSDVLHVPVAALLDGDAAAAWRKNCLRWLLAEAEQS